MKTPPLTRRCFLKGTLGAAAALTLPLPALARSSATGKLRFGVITDIHHDVMHDGIARVSAFGEAMTRENVDFIAQLGDFCQPKAANQPFLDAWNRFVGPRYHVLGNHDMDGGFTRDKAVAFYGMPARHYAFEKGGVRFIVLDGNDPGGSEGGYHRFIATDQKTWLVHELAAAKLPVIVLIHQPLENPGGIVNQEQIRAVLEKDRGPGHPGVAAVLTGHLHQDYVRDIRGIAHLQLNSASYVWLPESARRRVYDEAAHQAHPYLDHVAPYRDPLWALITIDHDAGTLSVQGRASAWVGPNPWERGAPEKDYPHATTRPAISDWSGRVSGI